MRSVNVTWFVIAWILMPSLSAGQNPAVDGELTSLNERKQAWKKKLESMPVTFDRLWNRPAFSSVDDSLKSLVYDHDHIKVHMIVDPQHQYLLQFRFFDKDREIVSLRGHRYSSFRAEDNLLFFADFLPDGPGCSVAAFNLTTGKENWRTKLHQKQPQGASAYRNRVSMILYSGYALPSKKDGGTTSTLQIMGSESYCDYVEILDANTGASLAIKHYRVGFGTSQPPGGGFGGQGGVREVNSKVRSKGSGLIVGSNESMSPDPFDLTHEFRPLPPWLS